MIVIVTTDDLRAEAQRKDVADIELEDIYAVEEHFICEDTLVIFAGVFQFKILQSLQGVQLVELNGLLASIIEDEVTKRRQVIAHLASLKA